MGGAFGFVPPVIPVYLKTLHAVSGVESVIL